MILESVFWFLVIVITYTYLGYPILLWFIGIFMPREIETSETALPEVAIIVPVHNEDKIIKRKLDNLLSLSYPQHLLSIIVISDASEDDTAQIVKQYVNKNIQFYELAARSGKAAALNQGLHHAQSEVVVFTDAAIILEKDALQHLLLPFTDPTIGCVSGEDHIIGQSGEGLYGRYELLLRNLESRIGSIVGASGCIYAQRRNLCDFFPEGVAPDFFSVLVTVDKGFRAITESRAIGQMARVKSAQEEFSRKTRTFLRGITGLMMFKHLLNPRNNAFFAIALLSHKLFRWISGYLLLILFCITFSLASEPIYFFTLILQLLFYCLALLGKTGPDKLHRYFWIRVPFFFCLVNLAAVVAIVKYLLGHRQEIWTPSRR